jgi:Cdc6-like AAA superfamily ATPase
VIDEVDCFYSNEKHFTTLVKQILKSPRQAAVNTSIIGIANRVDLPFKKKHAAIAMRDCQLLFKPYDAEDIESIID